VYCLYWHCWPAAAAAAAAHLCAVVVVDVVQEAGAVITDALGNPLDFSQGRFFPYLNGGIVAATPSMHRAIMAAIRKIRELEPKEE
jgi:fructose-1,6-bisphosphatase/inositol monophosphatase family enzyme